MTQNVPSCYTIITFAPVQGFIEKSRKLRDLYGSSYLLSLLSQALCDSATQANYEIISPALPNIIQGMPNQIIIRGSVSEADAKKWFSGLWGCIVETCREWIETNVKGAWNYQFWHRDWNLWKNYTWEFFHVTGKPGESITEVRQRLNEKKRSRDWTGINWQGESSTLSGTDAVAWGDLGKYAKPNIQAEPWRKDSQGQSLVQKFYQELSREVGAAFIRETPSLNKKYGNDPQLFLKKSSEFGKAFIDPGEELSIPELTKRLITHKAVVKKLIERMGDLSYLQDLKRQIDRDLNPTSFTDLNRLQHQQTSQPQYWTGWFQGDGDGASDYLKWLGEEARKGNKDEAVETKKFSTEMRHWGEAFKWKERECLPEQGSGRLIYAGGDDFLGVLYKTNTQLEPGKCLEWLSTFKSNIWHGLALQDPDHPEQSALMPSKNITPKKITPSVGFVWVAPKVPQREVLQHCRLAEKTAKNQGKDRVAFRIVFNGGSYLEWVCPWRILESGLFEQYRDRNGTQGLSNHADWTHFYNDIAVLESRHAFGAQKKEQFEIAQAIFQAYFGQDNNLLTPKNSRDLFDPQNEDWWNETNHYKTVTKAGILGNQTTFEGDPQKVIKALNNWVINLAKVGFYLCSNS